MSRGKGDFNWYLERVLKEKQKKGLLALFVLGRESEEVKIEKIDIDRHRYRCRQI